MYSELLNRVIPVYAAEDSLTSVVRSLPFKNAISVVGCELPVEHQYIFSSAAHICQNN